MLATVWHKTVSGGKNGVDRSGLKSFKAEQKSEEAFNQRDLGKREVRLEEIVGSVGRYSDFNSQFRLKEAH